MQRGFTLIELLVTISVAAILLGIAVPSYNHLIQSNRASSTANRLLSTFMLARSEAIQRNQRVVVCIVQSGSDACDTSATAWENGLMVFADANNDGKRDAQEAVIQVERPFAQQTRITGNSNVARAVSFDAGGRTSRVGTLTVDAGDNPDYKRSIVISTTGRSRVKS
ncbi:MAG: GspH/FimT family pseudopilin [Algiphilus sp.]|nr:GspH/FimT family pseudopilin [Algiphilus sp.]